MKYLSVEVIKKILIIYTSRILIFLNLSIDIILAIIFYNIKKVDYFILFTSPLLTIFIESLYERFIKKIYMKIIFIFIFIYGYIRWLHIWGMKDLQGFIELIQRINIKVYYGREIDFYEALPVTLIVFIFIIFLWYRIERKSRGNWALAVQFLYLCNISYFTNNYGIYMKTSILLSCLYFVINNFKDTKIKAQKDRLYFTVRTHEIVSYSVVVICFVFILSLGLVRFTGTNNLSQMRQVARNKLLENVINNFSRLYDISSNGFGKEGRLGGPLTLEEDTILRVESNKPYYLRGVVKDYYSGEAWIRKNYNYVVADKPVSQLLNKETQERVLGLTKSEDFKEPNNITIYNEASNSFSIFVPYNTVMVVSDKNKLVRSWDNTYMILDKKVSYNYYNISFYESNAGYENFEKFYKNKIDIDYNPTGVNLEALKVYEDTKSRYESYLQIPNTITVRTKELEKSIVAGAEGTEDKIYKIMQYLKTNYPYEMKVSNLPKGQDFLDYFLFNERKGYCTYFATAAVMFCRMEGIPARYVEGYSMDNIKDRNGLYVVKSNMAHAWCEVLVSAKDNLWAVLECTPASYRNVISGLEDSNENINKLLDKSIKIDLKSFDIDNQNTINSLKKITISVGNTLIKVLGIIGVFISISLMLLIFIRIRSHRSLVKHMINNNKISLLYYYTRKRLTSIGIEDCYNLSDQEYLDNLKDNELKEFLKEMVKVYEQEYYGNKSMDEYIDKYRCYMNIEKYIRDKQNILKYLIKKYELYRK